MPLFRALLRCDPPTLLIDEADTIFGAKAGDNEDLRGLLNAGHQRGRHTIRYSAARDDVDHLQTFAMAALAGIGMMPDTIEDRAAVIRMRRRAPGESVQPYRVRRDGPDLDVLRDELNRWLKAHLDELTDATPDMPVEDRAADTWEPMIAVADLAGGQWPRAARKAAVALTSDRDAGDEASLHTRLLSDCRSAFQDADALPTAELLDRLKADSEAPWMTYGVNGLTAMKLGNLLREFEIRSSNIRFTTGQAKGYTRSDFADAWSRYCPEPKTAPGEEGVPAVPGVPAQVSTGTASLAGTAQAVPSTQAVPGLTCDATAGTAGTAWGPRAVPALFDTDGMTRETA